jgi:hypothetical protein
MADPIVIPQRFNGPPQSANGGYTCGLVARLLGAGAAEVTLRSPPPLERPLTVSRDGEAVAVRDGETLVAEGRRARFDLEPPAPVGIDEAEAASLAGRERWTGGHPFPTCVVCGPDRDWGDGFRVFPGALPGRERQFAAVWTPEADAQPEHVWAALDCPTSAPVANFGTGPPMVLARLAVRRDAEVEPGRPHVVVSWPLDLRSDPSRGTPRWEGRKRHAGAALFSADGALLAVSRALWIELRM